MIEIMAIIIPTIKKLFAAVKPRLLLKKYKRIGAINTPKKLKKLSVAATLPKCSSGLWVCMKESRGTINKPPHSPIKKSKRITKICEKMEKGRIMQKIDKINNAR